MARQFLEVKTIKDWIPLLDPKQIPSVRVLEGRNFIITERGIESAFASSQVTAQGYSQLIETTQFTFQSFTAGGTHFIFTDGGIVEYHPASNTYETAYTFPHNVSEYYAWTHAYVGVHDYFAHKSAGCFRYSSSSATWEFVSSEILSVAAARGRLVGVTKTAFLWSAIDNGVDFVPSPTTGAGAQALSILGIEGELTVLGAESTFDGVYTFTTQGILYSRYQENEFVFNHIPLTVKTYPLNSHCIMNEEGLGLVFAAKTGFYKLDKGEFTAWQPAMSLYFRKRIIPNMFEDEQLALFWHRSKQRLYFSYAAPKGFEFTKAFVLDVTVDQWGHFDKRHQGFADFSGRLSFLTEGHRHELTGLDVDTRLPASAAWTVSPLNDSAGNLISSVAHADVGADRYKLESYVVVGGLKLLSETSYDRLTVLTSISIDREKWYPSVPDTGEDLNSVPVALVTDLANQVAYEALDFYSFSYESVPVPSLSVYGSETLDSGAEGVSEEASLNKRLNTKEVYACYSSGLYQSLRFSTDELGAKINANLISLGAFLGGKIY